MSDTTPQTEEQIIEEAKADYAAYLESFEKKYGYGIGAVSDPSLTPEGTVRVETLMKLVKLPAVATVEAPVAETAPAETTQAPETQADTTPNGDNPTAETSTSDSTEQQAA